MRPRPAISYGRYIRRWSLAAPATATGASYLPENAANRSCAPKTAELQTSDQNQPHCNVICSADRSRQVMVPLRIEIIYAHQTARVHLPPLLLCTSPYFTCELTCKHTKSRTQHVCLMKLDGSGEPADLSRPATDGLAQEHTLSQQHTTGKHRPQTQRFRLYPRCGVSVGAGHGPHTRTSTS